MPQQHNALLREHEDRIKLTLEALNAYEFRSQRAAAHAFNVKHQTLSNRARGVPFILKRPLNSRKLTLTEEQTIV
jgi:hypothetical protein